MRLVFLKTTALLAASTLASGALAGQLDTMGPEAMAPAALNLGYIGITGGFGSATNPDSSDGEGQY